MSDTPPSHNNLVSDELKTAARRKLCYCADRGPSLGTVASAATVSGHAALEVFNTLNTIFT
jgi:hypothetical protein